MPKFQDLSGMDLRPGGVSSIMADAVPPDRSNSSSAPPALQLATDSLFAFRVEYAQIFSDIRAHEDYYNFYESYSGREDQQKLPPPLEAFPFSQYNSNFSGPSFFDNYYGGQQGLNQHQQQQEEHDNFNRSNNVQIPQFRNNNQNWNGNIVAPTARRGPPGLNIPEPYPEQSSLGRSFNELGSSYSNSPSAQTALNTANFIWKEDNEDQQNYPRGNFRPQQDNNSFAYGNYNQHQNQNQSNFNSQGGNGNGNNGGYYNQYAHSDLGSEEDLLNELSEERSDDNPKSICRYYANGFCSRGDKCYYSHDTPVTPREQKEKPTPTKENGNNKSSRGGKGAGKEKNTSTRGGKTSANSTPDRNKSRAEATVISPSVNTGIGNIPVNAEGEYTNFDDVVGRIYSISKDQQGCRFLQKKLEERDAQAIQIIYEEVHDYISELMIDPFGNYLCQKLLEFCNPEQRLGIIVKVSDELVDISKNMHGTRAVQKLIECLTLPSQVLHVENALKDHVVELIQDLNGNHVIQRCLNLLSSADNQFIYDSVINGNNCIQVATHRHGCCVLQRCVDFASPQQKNALINVITKNAYVLVQDPYGNYVVQYVLKLFPELVDQLAQSFSGHLRQLATQKFSSNVIEKCLQVPSNKARAIIIEEILSDPTGLSIMLQDPFANYVVQTALTISDPKQHAALVEAIKPHLNSLGNTPYGKRIQSKILKDSSGESEPKPRHGGGKKNQH